MDGTARHVGPSGAPIDLCPVPHVYSTPDTAKTNEKPPDLISGGRPTASKSTGWFGSSGGEPGHGFAQSRHCGAGRPAGTSLALAAAPRNPPPPPSSGPDQQSKAPDAKRARPGSLSSLLACGPSTRSVGVVRLGPGPARWRGVSRFRGPRVTGSSAPDHRARNSPQRGSVLPSTHAPASLSRTWSASLPRRRWARRPTCQRAAAAPSASYLAVPPTRPVLPRR